MSLRCRKAGILTTAQDLGRQGYRRLGINPTGAMDTAAMRLINCLLDNDENAPVIEMHFPAGEFLLESDAEIAIGGADFGARLDDRPVELWQAVFARTGSRLRFRAKNFGNRTYLAVAGGFDLPQWLGSSSTNLAAGAGGQNGRAIVADDLIGFRSSSRVRTANGHRISRSIVPPYSSFPTVRILEGAEHKLLTSHGRKLLTSQIFVISQNSNRMGFQLDGEPLSLKGPVQLISSAVGFGTIQLLPDGNLIILMADHQTSGGYPRVGHVISRDIPLVAQLGARDKVAFEIVSEAEAEAALIDFEQQLRILKAGIRLRNL